jgi:hypothetical protein
VPLGVLWTRRNIDIVIYWYEKRRRREGKQGGWGRHCHLLVGKRKEKRGEGEAKGE